MKAQLIVALFFALFACSNAVFYQYVGPDCKPPVGLPIITLSRCTEVASDMHACSHAKIQADLINGMIHMAEAREKFEMVNFINDEWFDSCKRKVSVRRYLGF